MPLRHVNPVNKKVVVIDFKVLFMNIRLYTYSSNMYWTLRKILLLYPHIVNMILLLKLNQIF